MNKREWKEKKIRDEIIKNKKMQFKDGKYADGSLWKILLYLYIRIKQKEKLLGLKLLNANLWI